MGCLMLLSLSIMGGYTILTRDWDTKQWQWYNMMNMNTTIWTPPKNIGTLLSAQEQRLWVEKPCDSLQGLCHPKQNTLYVVLQKVIHDIIGYRIVIIMQYVNEDDATLNIFQKELVAQIKSTYINSHPIPIISLVKYPRDSRYTT